MKQITTKQLDQLILREEKKIQDPMAAQREQAEEQKFEMIKKLQELGEKIHGQINNSFEHLNAFMNLGTKTRDTFEYERAVAEIGRIQKLTANMAHLIKKAHDTATEEPAVQESPYDSRKMAQMANPKPIIGPRQQKPSPMGMGMQEIKYGVIMESYGQFKTVDIFAKSAAEALLKVRKANPAWEVKRIILIEESRPVKSLKYKGHTVYIWKEQDGYVGTTGNHYTGIADNAEDALETVKSAIDKGYVKEAAPVKGSKPPLFPDSKSSDQKPAKPSSKEPPVKEPASGSEVPPWFKGAYESEAGPDIPPGTKVKVTAQGHENTPWTVEKWHKGGYILLDPQSKRIWVEPQEIVREGKR